MKYYKLLNENGVTPHGNAMWHLPKNGQPGQWMPYIKGELIPCKNGYHILRFQDLLEWWGKYLWEVEPKGKIISDTDKCLCRKARLIHIVETWNDKNLRLLAADCAEHVLSIFEKDCPNDLRPQKVIETARAFARGKATKQELAAARAAAYHAADSAADYAAVSAASYAAYYAAYYAADSAADYAASYAARAKERQWQYKRLAHYLKIKADV